MTVASTALKGFDNLVGSITSRLVTLDTTVKRVGQGLALTGIGLTAGVVAAGKAAGSLEQSILNVRTIDQSLDLRNTTNQILRLSTEVPQAARNLSEGLYDIASSGQFGAQGLETLEVSAKAAAAGISSTDVAARAIVASMNAYGEEVGSAAEVSDVLFQTVNLGVLTFEELANNIGDWVGTASAAGVAFDEAAAGLAAMTLAGIPAFQAATSLNRVMMGFIEPSEGMTAALRSLGYESGVAAIEALGFNGTLQMLFETVGTDAVAISGLFNNVEAVRGAIALSANEGQNWARTIAGITNETARAGATQRAFETQMQGLDNRISVMVNSFQRARIEVGQYFVPIMGAVVDRVGGALDIFSELPAPVHMAVAAVSALSAVLITLAGVILASQLRMLLYRTVAQRFTQSTALAAVAQRGLTGAMMAQIPVATTWLATHTASVPVLSRVTGRLNLMATSVQRAGAGMMTGGRAAGALTLGLLAVGGAISAIANARSGAEATISEITSGFDQSNPEEVRRQIDAIASAYQGAQEARDSYFSGGVLRDIANVTGQGLAATFGSLIGIESGYYNARIGAAELGDELRAQIDILDNYDTAVEALKINLGLTTDQAMAFLQAQHPDLLGQIGAAYEALPEDMRGPGFVLQGDLIPSLEESFQEWQRNDGAAEDFGTTLRQMRDPILMAAGAVRELSDEERQLAQAMREIGTADFGETLNDQQSILGTFRSLVQEQEDYNEAYRQYREDLAEAQNQPRRRGETVELPEAPTAPEMDPMEFAEDMLAAGRITQETFDEMIQHIHDGEMAWDEFVNNHQLSLSEYAANLETANARLAAWQQNLLTIGGRVGQPSSEAVLGWLQSMGEEGVAIAEQMANATPEEFQRMVDAIIENTNSLGDPAVVAFQGAMDIMEEAGRQGGDATGLAIAQALGVRLGDVMTVVNRYATAIGNGLNPLLVALGGQRINLGTGTRFPTEAERPPGAIGPYAMTPVPPGFIGPVPAGTPRLQGPTYTPPPAPREDQLYGARAQGGFYRATHPGVFMMSEPETGGEWLIPRQPASRGVSVMRSAARDFGYEVVKMAHGGWNDYHMVHTYRDGGFHPTTIDRRQSRRYNYEFSGPMYMSDPRETVKFAERKSRLAKLRGVDA